MKKNYLLSLLSMALFMFIGFSSCSKDEPALTVTGSPTIEANGLVNGEIIVTASNTDWSVSVTKGSDWLTALKNGNKVSLTAKENTSIDTREATVVITATVKGDLYSTLTIKQKGAESLITVNGTSQTDLSPFPGLFDGKSGIDFKQTVKVESNVQWTVTGVPDWLSVSPANGKGVLDMVIYPNSENETSSDREATITLSGTGTPATIKAIQKGGKPVCYVQAINEVILHDRMCWEYNSSGNVNTYQWLLLSEYEYNRMTDKEILEEISEEEKLKYADDYILFVAYDNHNNKITSNTTYYLITLASNEAGKTGELIKKKMKTPIYKNEDDDAWVNFDNVGANYNQGFWFDAIKEGFCNTYHLIYGIQPSDNTYNKALYAFEINYWLKYKKKHWFAENWDMEIVTDYPNNHTFTYSTSYLPVYPLCFAFGWGVFKDGTLSSDIVGFQWDTSTEQSMRRINAKDEPELKNTIICRSVEVERAKKMRK